MIKIQIPNKFQITINETNKCSDTLPVSGLGVWNLFVIWRLGFGV